MYVDDATLRRFELHPKARQGANFHVPQASRSPVTFSRCHSFFVRFVGAERARSAVFRYLDPSQADICGRTSFYFVFGLGKLAFRSGPAPDFGLKKPWAEPCRSRPLRRAGIPNDHAAKRSRGQNSGGNRGPGEAGNRHSGRWRGISEECNLFWKSSSPWRDLDRTVPAGDSHGSVPWKDGSAADELLPTKWILFAHYGAQDTSSQLPARGIC